MPEPPFPFLFAPPMSVLVEILFLALAYIFFDGKKTQNQITRNQPTNNNNPFPTVTIPPEVERSSSREILKTALKNSPKKQNYLWKSCLSIATNKLKLKGLITGLVGLAFLLKNAQSMSNTKSFKISAKVTGKDPAEGIR